MSQSLCLMFDCDLTVKLPPGAAHSRERSGEREPDITCDGWWPGGLGALGWLIEWVDTGTRRWRHCNVWGTFAKNERVMMLKFRPIYGNLEPGGAALYQLPAWRQKNLTNKHKFELCEKNLGWEWVSYFTKYNMSDHKTTTGRQRSRALASMVKR